MDEAQDYLLKELESLKIICKKLHQAGMPTYLWLLGDLNQRIIPVNFNWGALHLRNVENPNWKCFRNSQKILEFSNLFLEPVKQKIHDDDARLPYEAANPEQAYEEGDLVKVIIYPSISEAEDFLHQLTAFIGKKDQEIDQNYSLIHKLACRAKILTSETYKQSIQENLIDNELEFLSVHEAKGREFDSCIAFNIFDFQGKTPISEDWWQWYTILTRTRSHLLLIITKEQYDLIRTYIPNLNQEPCLYERIENPSNETINAVCKWILTEVNDLDFSTQGHELIKKYLHDASQAPQPFVYWDMYEVLDQVGIVDQERSLLEAELLNNYREKNPAAVHQNTKEAKNPLVHYFLHRAQRQSWLAAESLISLKESNLCEYERGIQAIADDLTAQNLLIEAARIKFKYLGTPYPHDFPIPEITNMEGNLLSVLVHIFSTKFLH